MSRVAQDLVSSPHRPFTKNEDAVLHKPDNMHRLRIGTLPRVAIIGAGVSGLRCADLLTRAGSQVTVFEARNRIGGRVHQVDNGGLLVDTGSNWIHGTEGNPIMTLAKLTNTIVMEPEENTKMFDREGHILSDADSKMLSAEFWGMILEGFKYSDQHSAEIDADLSLAEWLQQQWTTKFRNARIINNLTAESKLWGQFVGSPVEWQSLKFFFLEEGLDGENVFVADTYQKILEEIAKPALANADVRLNTEIKNVQYRSGNTDAPVILRMSDGKEHDFDEVVVTCPLGWLKKNQSAFTPSLPPRLTKAIDSIGYGALEKLYIAFPSAFWLGKDNDLNAWPCFTNFHSPLYHPAPSSKSSTSWNQSVLSLSHLPGGADHPTLLFYMTADSGAYITEKIKSHETHSDSYNSILRDFAEPFYSLLPNYDSSSEACQPTSFYQTTWQNDPYAGHGSYSTFRTGLTEGDKDIEVMRDAGGLSDSGQGLWIAGEHTAPFVALGTTTGAWWSGEGVARRIAKQYGMKIPEDQFSKMSNGASDTDDHLIKQVSKKDVQD